MYVMTIDQRGSSARRGPCARASWRSWPACPRPGASSARWATRSRASWSGRTKSWTSPCTPCAAAAGTWASGWARWTCRCLPARGKAPARPSWRRGRPLRTAKSAAAHVPLAVVSGRPAPGSGCAVGPQDRPGARGLRQCRGGAAADRAARPGPDRGPVEGRGCAALGAARPLRHARHAENRCPGTGNHRTIGEPCAAALRLAGRMGREAGGGNAAGLRPWSNHRHRRRRRAACGQARDAGVARHPDSRPGTVQKETGGRPLDHADPAHCRLRRLAGHRPGLPARPHHRRQGRRRRRRCRPGQ